MTPGIVQYLAASEESLNWFEDSWDSGRNPDLWPYRHRTEALIETLRSRGVSIDPDARERIHGPVGLDIGADSPEEIAVAIVAEVQAVHAGRRGRFLVHRAGAIHARGAAPRQFLHQ